MHKNEGNAGNDNEGCDGNAKGRVFHRVQAGECGGLVGLEDWVKAKTLASRPLTLKCASFEFLRKICGDRQIILLHALAHADGCEDQDGRFHGGIEVFGEAAGGALPHSLSARVFVFPKISSEIFGAHADAAMAANRWAGFPAAGCGAVGYGDLPGKYNPLSWKAGWLLSCAGLVFNKASRITGKTSLFFDKQLG